jgi:pseudaminic acid synthase
MEMAIKIDGRKIGPLNPPYVVAEISGNHGGSLENAKRLIAEAKKAGADAVKTQCYEPSTITLDCKKPDFIIQDGLWRGRTLFELYEGAHTPFSWHKDLMRVAKDEGISIFSSVFDSTSVDYLSSLGAPAFKIASFEIVDIPLIAHASKTGKPIIISTGLANDREILDAEEAARGAIFLHCTSEYPGTVDHANLGRIMHLDTLMGFRNPIGISDHTMGTLIPTMATALGAVMIEKHIKLPGIKTEDEKFSMTPDAFQNMVRGVHLAYMAMQDRPLERNPSRQMRRSLYAVRDIKEGEEFSMENIKSIRPGYGLPPKMLPELIGKSARKAFRRGEPLS